MALLCLIRMDSQGTDALIPHDSIKKQRQNTGNVDFSFPRHRASIKENARE